MPLIVHLIDEFKIGGAQTHLVTMLRQVVTSHPHVHHHVISLFGDGPINAQIQTLGIETEILDLRPELARRQFSAAVKRLEQLIQAQQPHLVEAHLTWSRLIGLYAAWRVGVPLRVGFEQGDIYMNSLKFRLANFISQFYTHRFIVCSRALGDWVRKTHRISHQKLTVFHNCVDSNYFTPTIQPAADVRLGIPEECTLFVMISTLGRGVNKRVDIGIKALALARQAGVNVALVIAGDGEQRLELEQLARELKVEKAVKFLGMRSDIPQVLKACDIFCHAAPFEPFGIVCIEAMAMGLPVIVPNAGGMQEAVKQNSTGLIYQVLEPQSLAENMVKLHQSPKKRQQMKIAARQAAIQQYSLKSYIDKLYRLYGFNRELVI